MEFHETYTEYIYNHSEVKHVKFYCGAVGYSRVIAL